jgi:mRNA-degrading endonuclease toxin of MazEF toxin-antitoxin module
LTRPVAGEVVIVDWRGDRRPDEPGWVRPAIVVEASALFPEAYPNLLVVPLTRDERLVPPLFAERLDPDQATGVTEVCWALAHHVTSVSLTRVKATGRRVSDEQLVSIRDRVAAAVGR